VLVTAIAREASAASRDGFGEDQPCTVDVVGMPRNARHVGMLALPTIDHQGDQFLRRRDGDGKTAALVLANDSQSCPGGERHGPDESTLPPALRRLAEDHANAGDASERHVAGDERAFVHGGRGGDESIGRILGRQ
jgi:hypothetical protein